MHPYTKYQWPTVGNGKTSSHPDKLVWEEQLQGELRIKQYVIP